jgi:hypothetical protein
MYTELQKVTDMCIYFHHLFKGEQMYYCRKIMQSLQNYKTNSHALRKTLEASVNAIGMGISTGSITTEQDSEENVEMLVIFLQDALVTSNPVMTN